MRGDIEENKYIIFLGNEEQLKKIIKIVHTKNLSQINELNFIDRVTYFEKDQLKMEELFKLACSYF